MADVAPPEPGSSAGRGERERIARRHRGGPAIAAERLQRDGEPLEEQGGPRLRDEMGRVVAGAAVHPQADRHPASSMALTGAIPVGSRMFAGRTMGDARAVGGETGDARGIELHAVCVPYVGPTQPNSSAYSAGVRPMR